MKNLILSVLLFFFALPCVAEDKNTLVVHLTDGTSVGFLLAERPSVTFAGDSLRIVSSVAEAAVLRSEVRRFEFVADAASSVVDVPTALGECVISENQLSVSGLSADGVAFVPPSASPRLTPPSDTDSTIEHSPSEAIDLGLSVKWASCNVGASSPEEYGGYYAWGETEEKIYYSLDTYKWDNGSLTKYCIESYEGTVDNKTVLEPEDDVAHVKWGGGWRMPTQAEQEELFSNCSWTWTTLNGVNGCKVTGPNGNSIFLPAAGNRIGTEVNLRGSGGYYWSASLKDDGYSIYANNLIFAEDSHICFTTFRSFGLSVRPVCDK